MEANVKTDIMVDPAWIADNLDNPSVRMIEVSDMKNANAGRVCGGKSFTAVVRI